MAATEARVLPPPGGTGQLRHELRAIYAIWLRDIVRFKSERTRIVSAFAQPLIYLAVMGTGLGATVRLAAAPQGFSYLAFMYPGILGMTVLFAALFSAISVIWDREFGFLREILVAPISRASIVLGKVLGGATVAAFQGTVLLFLAPIVGVPLGVLQIVELGLVMFLAASALTSLGLAIASRMSSMEGFQVVMNFLVIPMWLLSGAFFPLRGLPGWMMVLTRVDPLTYAVDALRGIVYGQTPLAAALVAHSSVLDVAVVMGFLVVMLALALGTFRSRED
jgi:ABC-2 type transport system permease protein